ncbi:hypothetical protein ACFLWA_00580 [Chloroflexota bacterium]
MTERTMKQGMVWGGVLIVVGLLLLLNQFVELSVWIWVLLFAASGLGALGLYLGDRSNWGLLLTTYILWAIALLVALITLDVLRDEAVAFYVLIAIALPFLGVFYRDRAKWWALIPAYVLIVVGVMVGLIGLGLLDDLLVPAFILIAISIPFFVVYLRDRRLWWALIPGGILAVIGVSFLFAENALGYIGALVLILVGVGILVRGFTRKDAPGEDGPPGPNELAPTRPETDTQAERHEE